METEQEVIAIIIEPILRDRLLFSRSVT